MQTIQVGRNIIGNGHPPAFWADIDVYFKGDEVVAKKLIDELAAAGANTVKGALLHDLNICLPQNSETSYYIEGKGIVEEPYYDILKRHVCPLDKLERIYKYAQSKGMDVVLSVYDFEGVDFAVELGVAAIKIPTSNIVHHPLIKYASKTGLPIVLDTGKSTMNEIERAIKWVRCEGNEKIIVQHSPPGPPAPPEKFHLNMMVEIGRRFGVFIGLSDHFAGNEMMYLATALGAHVVEKGLCSDDSKEDIDLAHALKVKDVQKVVSNLEISYKSLGDKERVLENNRPRPKDRMGLLAKGDLRPGETITESKLKFAFPTLGIPVENWEAVLGRKICSQVRGGEPLLWKHLEND